MDILDIILTIPIVSTSLLWLKLHTFSITFMDHERMALNIVLKFL